MTITVAAHETTGGKVVSVVLFMLSMGILCVCLSRRVANVQDWRRLPPVCWIVIVIYIDSLVFIMGASIISHGFDMEDSSSICGQAILLCLACYMTTKFIYYFLVERAWLISGTAKSRFKDKLYLFNSLGMLVPYCVVIALNFYFRFAEYDDYTCRIGMKKQAMIPLIVFDILVNVYLTILFLLPLRSLYSYRNNRNSQARSLATRTFIGSCCTLTSSIVNLTVVMVLEGEPGWICLMCCNVDILFSVLVLHWITSHDRSSSLITPTIPLSTSSSLANPNCNSLPPLAPPTYISTPKRLIPRAPLSDLEAFEYELRTLRRATIITSITADGQGRGVSRSSDDLGLQLTRTWTKSKGDGVSGTGNEMDKGVVKIEIRHQRTVEAVGVCGVDLDGNFVVGYGVDAESENENTPNERTDKTGSQERLKVEDGKKESSHMERRGSGWVREGRLMAERIGVGGGTGSREGLFTGGAPMERLDG